MHTHKRPQMLCSKWNKLNLKIFIKRIFLIGPKIYCYGYNVHMCEKNNKKILFLIHIQAYNWTVVLGRGVIDTHLYT